MILIDMHNSFSLEDVLFVFALESEAGDFFSDYNKIICGIGKINATYNLTKAIQTFKPKVIINLGSAGSSSFAKGTVVCCRKFIQRDMNVTGLGFDLFETPLSNIPPILEYGLKMDNLPEAICGTGDNFETTLENSSYNVVDMEAYALAYVAMKENIPFLSLKYISDGADDLAAEDWTLEVHNTAEAFANLLSL